MSCDGLKKPPDGRLKRSTANDTRSALLDQETSICWSLVVASSHHAVDGVGKSWNV